MTIHTIKNFDVLETMIPEDIFKNNNNQSLKPVLVFNINTSELPWNYHEWEFLSFENTDLSINISFTHKKETISLVILPENITERVLKIINNYNDLIISLTDSKENNTMFYYGR